MPARPNFFIVGSPRCGTTALWAYLRSHPNIFMAAEKEPHFFAGDFNDLSRGAPYRESLDAYLELFRHAGDEHRAVGESSVRYIYAPGAIERILQFNPDARIIVGVRNPVDMSRSLHARWLLADQEDVPEFEKAWALQEARLEGRQLPNQNTNPFFVQYRAVCSLGSRVEELYRVVPASQRKVIVFDDFRRDTRAVYRDLLDFLDVPDDGRVEFPRVNEAMERRSGPLAQWTRYLPRWLIRWKREAGLGSVSLMRILSRLYMREAKTPPLDPDFRLVLARDFRDDVSKLSDLLGRDLTGWCRED